MSRKTKELRYYSYKTFPFSTFLSALQFVVAAALKSKARMKEVRAKMAHKKSTHLLLGGEGGESGREGGERVVLSVK